MAGFGLSNENDKDRFSVDVGTNNESASSWGNGLAAEVGTGLESSGGMAESMSGVSQDLGLGPSYGTTGAGRTFSDWTAGGVGAAYGGDISSGAFNWSQGVGVGVGGGFGEFSQETSNQLSGWERTAEGYAAGLAGTGHFDTFLDSARGQSSLGGDIYRGVGGSAYGFNDTNAKTGETRSGVGMDANYTPLGFNDVNVGGLSAGNVEVGRVGGHGEAYTTGDGGFGVQGGVNMGRNTATDINLSGSSALGETDASVGRVAAGRFHQGGVEVGGDGSVTANYSRGGMLTVEDASVTHESALGTTSAELGKYGALAPTRYSGGYDATENQIHGEVADGSGWVAQDVGVSHTAGDYDASVNAGRIESGVTYTGSGNVDLDDGTAHFEASGRSGMTVEDANATIGTDGARVSAGVGKASNANEITNAHLDYGDGKLSAGVEEARINGMGVDDATASLEAGPVNANVSAGHVSNDTIIQNAYAEVEGTTIRAGADKLDGGGIRGENVSGELSIGDDFTAQGGVESFGNTNSAEDVHFESTADRTSLDVGSFAVAGTDVSNANLNVDGPGGSYVDASLGTYHSGATGKGVNITADGSGLSASADELGYDAHQIKDASVAYGVEGVADYEASVGEAHMSQARVNGLDASVTADGARLSVDGASYSHLGASDVNVSSELFDGAVGSNASIGEVSYAGGSVGETTIETNPLDGTSSINANDINAHYLTGSDIEGNVNVGDARATVGADELAIGNANIGNVTAESSNWGLTQNASATDVDVDLVKAEGLNAGLSYGDQNILSATTDLEAGVGADRVEGAFDLTQGTASGAIENGSVTAMVDNASIGVGDYNIDIGRTGVDANINAAGEVDLFNGTASGEASLAGTELSAFGYSTELGDWAQASGAVDVSQGAASFNVGGENGVGADMNLAEGNLDLNVAGYEIDVDEGIRAAGSAIADGASYVADSVGDFFSGW